MTVGEAPVTVASTARRSPRTAHVAEPLRRPAATDVTGERTLRLVYEMPRLNQWIYDLIRPHLGRTVLEVGCGIGCFTELLAGLDRVIAFDVNPEYTDSVARRFDHLGTVSVFTHDIQRPLPEAVRARPLDSVVCLNVLEHIRNDVEALRHMRRALSPGGNVILLVPAIPALYNPLDRELRHYRRYSRARLNATLRNAGLEPEWHAYVNLFGVLGWFLNGTLLRRTELPSRQMLLYNALAPAFRRLERLLGPPIGLSHVVSAR